VRGRGRGRVRVSPPLHAGHDHALEQVAQPVRLVLGGELLRVEHVDEEAAHHDEDHRAHAHLRVPLLRLVHVELVRVRVRLRVSARARVRVRVSEP
jgi:hypothetical protein